MLFLRSGLFMCGGFTHNSGDVGSRQAVLRRGDAVRQRLTRHLLSLWIQAAATERVLMVLPPPHTRPPPPPPPAPAFPPGPPPNRNRRPASVVPAALESTAGAPRRGGKSRALPTGLRMIRVA